jgi:cytochrome c biogenesis protein CcdA
MLPAYLSWFLGAEATAEQPAGGPLRGLVVGAVVSAGFMAVFAVAGAILAWISHEVYDVAPWITLVIGALLVVGGALLLAGRELTVVLPRLDRGGRTQGLGSMFVFGVSYAIASIGCTLPVFFATLSTTFRDGNVLSGLAYFAVYGLGMALVLMVLTLALSVVGRSMVGHVRRILPFVNRTAGALLVVAGCYVTWYGIVEIRGSGGDRGPVKAVTDWSASAQRWVDHVGAQTLGLALALVFAVAVLVALLLRGDADHHDVSDAPDPPDVPREQTPSPVGPADP